jgi:cytochrome c biogenesis protein CcmG/thiol:disulfide interchange protein DsbE
MRRARRRLAHRARRGALATGLLCLAGVALACGDPSAGRAHRVTGESATPKEREPAPDFEHPDLEGTPVRLSALRGKTVVIDFWATWCPPCAFQPPELNAFWEKHGDSGKLAVLGVEVGGASVDEIRSWAGENHAVAHYPILTGADEDLARRFGAMGFPALVVVAPDGTIDSVHLGLTTADELEQFVSHVTQAGASG